MCVWVPRWVQDVGRHSTIATGYTSGSLRGESPSELGRRTEGVPGRTEGYRGGTTTLTDTTHDMSIRRRHELQELVRAGGTWHTVRTQSKPPTCLSVCLVVGPAGQGGTEEHYAVRRHQIFSLQTPRRKRVWIRFV